MQARILFESSENERALNALTGLQYQREFIDAACEAELLARVQALPFREFEFHGYLGKRRIVSFGWRYEYSGRGELKRAQDIPDFLLGLRRRAASFAQLEPEALQQVLVTEYRAGAGIGWHRDKPVFDQVVGVSLLAPCLLRFRRKIHTDPNARTVNDLGTRESFSPAKIGLLAARASTFGLGA